MALPVVKLKRSAVPDSIPTTSQLPLGEVAINTYDGKLFIKKDNGTESIVEIGAGGGGGISNVVEDTTPQLGGNLDTNGNNITSTGLLTISSSGLNVSAPSDYTGNVLDLQVGGTSKFYIDKDGFPFWTNIVSNNADTFNTNQKFAIGGFFVSNKTNGWSLSFGTNNGSPSTTGGWKNSTSFVVRKDALFGWTNQGIGIGANDDVVDLSLFRDSANVLAQRNSTSPNTFRVYNTYTSATDFERANVGWTTNTFIVGTEKGSAGGTARQLELQTDGTTAVTINTSQNVGIGKTPTEKLDVNGTVKATTFSGSGSSLTNVVNSITAGTGISVDQSTGAVTITATGTVDHKILDDISGSFNGSTTAFTLSSSSTNFINSEITSVARLMISVGGVIQQPDPTQTSGFYISGGTNITTDPIVVNFVEAPKAGQDFFGVAYGLTTSPSAAFVTEEQSIVNSIVFGV